MSEKILVVDDEHDIADLLEVYLKNENYTVYKYYSAMEALECIEREELDLAILDIMLPGVDGFSICQKIRERYTTRLSYKKLELDMKTYECLLDGELVALTPTEFSILQLLLKQAGNVVSLEELFRSVWKDEYYNKNSSTITVHIRHLREKLRDTGANPTYIKTIWGVGYKI